MTLPSRAQTVVIGAGIVGVCTAMYLAREKHETVLLDRGSPWSDASGINAGTLSLQVKAPAVWSLCALALKLWSRLVGEIKGDLGFVRSGGLRVALDHGECAQLAESVRAQRAAGLAVELLERDELTEQAPWLGGEVLAASRCDEDAYASPLLAGPALLQAAESSGVLVGAHTEVTAFERCAEGYRVHTECGEIYCRNLVISAGAGTEMLAAQLGISIPVSADLNMLHVTEAAPQFMSGIITHIGGVLSLKQYTNGTCVIGGGWQGRGSLGEPSPQIDHENLHHNLRIATRVVPALRDLRLVRSWTGFEALAADGLPVLGAVPGHDGLYVGACARGGYTLGPAQAWILSQQIVGRPCELDISAFGPARFQPCAT